MDKIFHKFLNTYFFNTNKLEFKEDDLTFKNSYIFKRLLIVYFISFLIFFLSIWFIIDLQNKFYNIFLFIFSFVSIFLANWYVIAFFFRNNKIWIIKWVIYFLTLLLFIPTYCLLIFPDKIPQLSAYYFFYMFFLIIIFYLIPKIHYFFLNSISNIKSFYGVLLFFFKSFFIKLDSHNIEKVVNSLYINKDITSNKVEKHLYNLKNRFRFYWGVLVLYTFVNLFFGVSVYSFYNDYFSPFMKNLALYMERFADWSNWLIVLLDISFIVIFLFILLAIWFLIINTFFIYLEIYFFDLLYDRLKKKYL